MGTISSNLLPNATGLDLGSPSQRFDVFAKTLTADSLTTNSPNPATSGTINLASTDTIAWRNAANNANILLAKSQALAGAIPADTLTFSGGGIEAAVFISSAANPASAGIVRLAAADAINFRNNANSGDIAGLDLNGDDSLTIGGSAGIHTGPVVVTGAVTATGAGAFTGALSGDTLLLNNAAATARFGGATSAFPMLKRSTTQLQARLADDSGAATLSGNLVVPATGTLQMASGALLTQYNGITLTGNGLPCQVATVDLQAVVSAASGITIYTVGATDGQFRLSWNAHVHVAGSVSSTLGALTIHWTDQDGTALSAVGAAQIAAGTIATTSTANTTATILLGAPMLLNCKAATTITYDFGYAANAANSMQYSLHIKLEALDI